MFFIKGTSRIYISILLRNIVRQEDTAEVEVVGKWCLEHMLAIVVTSNSVVLENK